jgi:hypothetical protein
VAFWCDYDNNGKLDIVQVSWSDHEDGFTRCATAKAPGWQTAAHHNNGDGTFKMRNREIGLTGCFGNMSANAGDFNNDGYLDLVLGNGSPRMDRLEPP